jgi:hypothetical protein
MKPVANDTEFVEALERLDPDARRRIAVRLVEHALPENSDTRLERALKTAAAPDVTEDELKAALKNVRAVVVDSHTRCGSEGDWGEQALYFAARAAVAALGVSNTSKDVLAAATNARMAKTCEAIGTQADTSANERASQYALLAEFLDQ